MNAVGHGTWPGTNQHHLTELFRTLRDRIEAHVAGSAAAEMPEVAREGCSPTETSESQPALEALTASFGLSAFERLLLSLCAGVELDTALARACAAAQGNGRHAHATFGLALAILPGGHWSAISPGGPLRRWRLVELIQGESLAESPLRIDERVLHYLTGVSYLDDRLEGLLQAVPAESLVAASHDRLAERAAAIWSGADTSVWSIIQLCGRDRGAKTAVAAAACRQLGLGLLRLRAENVPRSPGERTALARLCERELALSRSALLLVDERDTPDEDGEQAVLAFSEEMAGPLLIASREPLRLEARTQVRMDVKKPDHPEQLQIWRHALGEMADRVDGRLETLVTQFDLSTNGIRAAGRVVTDSAPAEKHVSFSNLWDACRVQARRRLNELAERIDSRVGWIDLVLPPLQIEVLNEISLHVRHSRTVYQTWGFAAKSQRGLGIGALFSGASGTGKTLAAEVLANELRLDLYRIDLSQVVSKYIGETEKNLRRIFEAAEESGAILLFDEADALFGKRSDVKDSHDRYANIEVSYLLQRMEAYRGLAILTTNMKSALDPAFLRRIRFAVQFPFPNQVQREEIWRRVFPEETPTDGLDMARLARMNITGGNIRSIAMNAAFLAAEADGAVGMTHVLRAARSEYAKLDKPLSAAELGGRE